MVCQDRISGSNIYFCWLLCSPDICYYHFYLLFTVQNRYLVCSQVLADFCAFIILLENLEYICLCLLAVCLSRFPLVLLVKNLSHGFVLLLWRDDMIHTACLCLAFYTTVRCVHISCARLVTANL